MNEPITINIQGIRSRGPLVRDENGVQHPEVAEVILDSELFVAEDAGDWAPIIDCALYGLPQTPKEAQFKVAAIEMVKMMVCGSCDTNKLDPTNSDAASLGLCEGCLAYSEDENRHSDEGHTASDPHPNCRVCQTAGWAWPKPFKEE